ncbi:hypothetical protein HMSSN036_50530 [Paenibacillus macerans]|nr:hypothetical protein HMSSN036_50530 [Paenibacillus macerans]
MNYPFTEAVLDFVVRGTLDAAGFAHAIGKQLSRYPQQASEVAFNLLDSHDTPRLLTLCEGNKAKMKLAALFQFTYAGTPCIYYGDEIGLDGAMDPDSRKCMEWDADKQDRELFKFYRELIAVRKELAPLRTGSIRFLIAEAGGSKLAYERKLDGETVLVLLNNYDAGQTFEVSAAGASWQDRMSGQTYKTESGKLTVKLPAYGYAVLTESK